MWVTTGNNIYYNTGNVGIGTNNPTQILQVGGGGRLRIANSSSDYTLIGASDVESATNTRIAMYGNTHGAGYAGNMEYMATSTGNHMFFTGGTGTTYGAERLRIASNGNIGIGTNAPFSGLHLHNNATTADCRIIISDNTSTASSSRGFHLIKGGDNLSYLWNYENTATVFATNNAERLRITSNGNIGIGTNNPSKQFLQVNGAVMIGDGDGDSTRMQYGSLNIGSISRNYGGSTTSWSTNTAGLVMECAGNTEIVIHHYGSSLHSFMRYVGVGNFTIGRNMQFGTANVYKGNNGTAWDQTSDHRIKENIKKANLTICYDNVKNINLYRFNYKDAFGNGKHRDRTQLGFVAQQVNLYYPKSITRGKRKLDDNREVPDLASIDVSQVNFTLFGAVKQLIRVVEKQSNRIKKLEEMLNIVEDDEVENDSDEPYVKIVCEGEVDIDTIVPCEPEADSSNTSNVF
jgi:hypothetical protein